MSAREEFIAHVRARRRGLFRPGLPDGELAEALALLGLDDASLERWSGCATSLVSLPHASPNVFDPRTRVGWYAGTLMRRPEAVSTHHLRVVLTHTNFSDLGWRPYAWWYLSEAEGVRCHRLFTRNKKRKHVVVAGRGPLDSVPEGMVGADLVAARAAQWGADLAVSYMLIDAVIGRAAGMTGAGTTTFVPLTLVLSFVREQAAAAASRPSLGAWCGGLVAAARGRRIGPDRTLLECPADKADVFDNYSNLAALCVLGRTQVLGGAKMAGYWPEVEAVIGRLEELAPDDCRAPKVLVVPEADLLGVSGPSPEVAAELARQGVRYSQGLAVAEHGDFAARHNPFAREELRTTGVGK
ncbi:hypothetical protein OG508_14580 [Streptomyces sp. NBC_01108]|uniref:hypothetical protein n=1 Tax=Streptomyces sp. NBC_01108 TaxID=2903751 RepID=UPI003872DF04|nr:hypothetical protein OG508_14580 [Streptomyces sp. NBC_01108]